MGWSFRDWFGVDQYGRDFDGQLREVDTLKSRLGMRLRVGSKKRLLIIDGFSGHCDTEVSNYAEAFDIEILALPPHSTHIMQPCDVGIFSPLKASHQRILRSFIEQGTYSFTRTDFVNSLDVSYD